MITKANANVFFFVDLDENHRAVSKSFLKKIVTMAKNFIDFIKPKKI